SLAAGLREGDEPAVLLYPDAPALQPFAQLGGGMLETRPVPGASLTAPAPLAVAGLTRRLRALRPRVVHVTDVWSVGMLAAWLAHPRRRLVTHHTPELPRRDNATGGLLLAAAWATRPEVIYTSDADRR